MMWHIAYCHQDYFMAPLQGKKGKHSQLQVSMSQDYSLAQCDLLSLGMLHHCKPSHSFRFAKHFSFSYFCLFSSFCFGFYTRNSKKLV
jgi:hypothetical protein